MIKRRKIIVSSLVFMIALSLLLVMTNTDSKPLEPKEQPQSDPRNSCNEDDKEYANETEFSIVVCRGNSNAKDNEDSFQRQLRQITVLLKSAAALTSRSLIFNIASDSMETYNEIINITQDWPEAYRQRIVFGKYKEIFYPPGTEYLKNMFRPCATERLFLAQSYVDKDSMVFLDTDTLFLRPPEDLLCKINKFGNKHIMSIAPCLYMYGPAWHKFPTYGSSGLNAGVLLMNLTRIREFEDGWTETILHIVKKYKGKLLLADQDILNILFSSKERAAQLYELGCEWNYREKLCTSGRNKCKYAEKVGIGLLHGAALTFVNGKEQKFQAVFEAWEEHQLGEPLSAFATNLKRILKKQKKSKGCTRMRTVNKMLLKGLMDTIKIKEL